MIICSRIVPCDTVILDQGSHWMTAVNIYDCIQPTSYPYVLSRLGIAMLFERSADDPQTLEFVIKLRFVDECFFTSNVFTVGFVGESHTRYALNITLAGCAIPRMEACPWSSGMRRQQGRCWRTLGSSSGRPRAHRASRRRRTECSNDRPHPPSPRSGPRGRRTL